MATQYIKDTKKCKKNFFPNYRGGHGPFWPGGGYAHAWLFNAACPGSPHPSPPEQLYR